MCSRAFLFSAAALTACLGCSSITIDKPANGSTVSMPQETQVTEKGSNVCYDEVLFDSFNPADFGGSRSELVPKGRLLYAAPGSHTLFVGARNCKLHQNISASSTFTVSRCPLCFTCPAGQVVNPSSGQCCDNGKCDAYAFGNFGQWFYSDPACLKETSPGSGKWLSELDCINLQVALIRGATPGPPAMLAVSFPMSRTGALAQIRVPIGWMSGTNGIQVWITEDAAGSPGTVLEAINQTNLRSQPQATTVDAPVHIFSATHPTLTTGRKYWLVIGPAAPDTVVSWNLSLILNDASIPADTKYLLNTTTGSVTGPWAPKSNLAELRPAFEVDVR
jgi:hypothetical protein